MTSVWAGEQGPGGYIFPAVVPPRRTLLVSCNVVAISTESILSVEGAVDWFHTDLKKKNHPEFQTDQPASGLVSTVNRWVLLRPVWESV